MLTDKSKSSISIPINSSLNLKVLQVSDITPSYIKWMNTREIVQYTEQNLYQHNHESVSKFVNRMFLSETDFLFGIFYINRHIGNIKLGPINLVHKKADISYIIGDSDYWGKGIATIVIKAVVEFAFKELKLHKLYASVYENNFGSSKVLIKNGFTLEGHFKEDLSFEDVRIDQFRYGLINPHSFSKK